MNSINSKIDQKDIKLLYILSNNSKTPISQISKQLKLSNDAIKNRILKLENEKIIKGYKTNISFQNLNLKEFDIYLKLKNFSQKELNEIIKYLKKNEYTTWIGTTFGKYDIRISLVVNSSIQINEFIEKFSIQFKNQLIEYQILEVLEKYKISQKKIYSNLFNIEEKNLTPLTKQTKKFKIETKKTNLDSTDKKIIQLLNENPKNSLLENARKINLTPEGLKYRITNLQKENIITKNSIILDGNKLNKIWGVILFKINSADNLEFTKFLQNQKNISAFIKYLGNYNYSATIFANNVSEIHKILMSFRNKFPEIILDYEMNLIFDTYKYPSIPEIIYK